MPIQSFQGKIIIELVTRHIHYLDLVLSLMSGHKSLNI